MSEPPHDILCRAACRIRWQQRLLCALDPAGRLDLSPKEAEGLYYVFEDILDDLAEAMKQMDERHAA